MQKPNHDRSSVHYMYGAIEGSSFGPVFDLRWRHGQCPNIARRQTLKGSNTREPKLFFVTSMLGQDQRIYGNHMARMDVEIEWM